MLLFIAVLQHQIFANAADDFICVRLLIDVTPSEEVTGLSEALHEYFSGTQRDKYIAHRPLQNCFPFQRKNVIFV
jgi:hypothetical protein